MKLGDFGLATSLRRSGRRQSGDAAADGDGPALGVEESLGSRRSLTARSDDEGFGGSLTRGVGTGVSDGTVTSAFTPHLSRSPDVAAYRAPEVEGDPHARVSAVTDWSKSDMYSVGESAFITSPRLTSLLDYHI